MLSVVENKADDDEGMEAGEKASHTFEPNRNKDTAAVENFILFCFCLSSGPMGDGVLIAIYSISVFLTGISICNVKE